MKIKARGKFILEMKRKELELLKVVLGRTSEVDREHWGYSEIGSPMFDKMEGALSEDFA